MTTKVIIPAATAGAVLLFLGMWVPAIVGFGVFGAARWSLGKLTKD